MSWFHNEVEVTEPPKGYIGFVYCITNQINGRKYIGKKLFVFRHKQVRKGKSKTILKESDWKKYYGSNEHLKNDVEEFGSENFHRKILYFCKGKGEMTYIELREQMDRRVLESDEYYNGFVGGKISSTHIKKWLLTK